MGIQYRWYDPNRKDIILIIYEDAWTWDDFVDAKEGIDRLLYSVESDVFVINDHTDAPMLPTGRRSIFSEIKNAFNTAPPNLAGVYTIGVFPLLRVTFNSLRVLTGNRLLRDINFVKTLDEAISLIGQQQEQSLTSD